MDEKPIRLKNNPIKPGWLEGGPDNNPVNPGVIGTNEDRSWPTVVLYASLIALAIVTVSAAYTLGASTVCL